jgi:hypothetical protein
MAERIEIYTAIAGDRDDFRKELKCFTEYDKFVKPVMNAKIYKVLSHKFIDADISIWVDGNIWLLIPVEQLVEEWLGDADMALWKHHSRDCIYDEGAEAKGLRYEDQERVEKDIDEQIDHYRKIGVPEHIGMGECNVIIRRNNEKVKRFNEAWWAEICRWSQRDQISFPVVLKEFPDLKVNFIEGDPRDHKYFSYKHH